MIELISIVCGTLAVAGVVANNRKVIWCFPIWMISNSMSAGLHVHAELYSLAARDVVFLVLAVEGWIIWKRKGRK